MHRFHSKSVIARFKIASVLICVKCLLVPAAAFVLGYGLFMNEHLLIFTGLGMAGGVVFLAIAGWIVAARTRCPLCMTPVLAGQRCSKHRKARTVLGSHRLRVALAVVFRGSFYCPYCNEPSALVIRERRR